jgi:hypothetical protein
VDPDERDPRPLGPIQVQAFEERGGPLWAQCARE